MMACGFGREDEDDPPQPITTEGPRPTPKDPHPTPKQRGPCVCHVDGDPLIQDTDDANQVIVNSGAVLLSRWDDDSACDFESRIHAGDSYGFIAVDILTYEFGQKDENGDFYARVSVCCDHVSVDGPSMATQEYTFEELAESEVTLGRGVTMRVGENRQFELVNFNCNHRLTSWFHPVQCWFSRHTLSLGEIYRNRGNLLDGMCGDCDGRREYQACFTHEDLSQEEDRIQRVAQSCTVY